jgi:ribosomal protein S18 acetylase RimI-like enzyme
MITVRESKSEDAEGVARVDASARATLRETYRPNQKAISRKQAITGELRRLVAVSDGAIVGTTQFYVDGNAMRIIGLGVHSDFRRQGVARALLAEVADRTRRLGLPALVTRTVEETGNVPIFEALGFEVQSRSPDEHSESVSGTPLTDVSMKMVQRNLRLERTLGKHER